MTVPIYNMTDTWNNAGTTYTAIKMNVTNTASAAGSMLMDLQIGGTTRFNIAWDGANPVINLAGTGTSNIYRIDGQIFLSGTSAALYSGNLIIASGGQIGFNGALWHQAADLILARDAANTLALRNSGNAQTFNVYNTYTDGSNYERFIVGWDSNICRITMQKSGAGSSREMALQSLSTLYLDAGADGGSGALLMRTGASFSVRWQVNSSGHFLAGSDNTYDIGASGATRPRNLYLSNGVFCSSVTTNFVIFDSAGSRGSISSQSDGVFTLLDNNGTSFGRLQFGGTTSSFPAWARDSAGMKIICADGTTGTFISGIEQTAPSAPSANGYRIFAQDNGAGKTQLMVIFGSGAAQQIAIEP